MHHGSPVELRTAATGAALWSGWALTFRPTWTACLVAFAPLVLVPLGLVVAARPDAGPRTSSFDLARRLSPAAAVPAALSYVPDTGLAAAALTGPWLFLVAALAIAGIGRMASRQRIGPAIGIDAGLVLLVIGAASLTVSRAGRRPLGFSDAIIELTAIHFNYAAFALPVAAGLAAARLGRSVVVPALVVIAVPATGVGITIGGRAEWVTATVMAAAGVSVAIHLLRLGSHARSLAHSLLLAAGSCLAAGMVLAAWWAWALWFGWDFLGLEGMARYHGTLNALGFGLLGLLGLAIQKPGAAGGDTTLVRLRRPTSDDLVALRESARRDQPTCTPGLDTDPAVRPHRRDRWSCELPHGFEAACEALRRWEGHRGAGVSTSGSTPLAVGETVALAIPVGPLTLTAACRIVDVVDETDRFGFTYATLPHHPQIGEESFMVERLEGGGALFVVSATWRPKVLAARVAPAIGHRLQSRSVRRYLDGVASWTPARIVESGR